MTPKERILSALRCEKNEPIPVTTHWWGLYKFAHAGLVTGYEDADNGWKLNGKALADVDERFYEDFKPDTFHLNAGGRRRSLEWFSDRASQEQQKLFRAVKNLESYEVIDEYFNLISESREDVLAGGEYDHVRCLRERYGDTVPLLVNEGNPISNILDPHGCVGFEEGLIALIEEPEKMEYLINRAYDAILPRMEALKASGADGYIGSETYCTPDLISPDTWRNLIYPAQKRFYGKLKEMGLISISYFLGDIIPLIEDLKQMNLDALMVEEPKKQYSLDIGKIYDHLEQSLCLFGNLDSVYVLQMGSRKMVVEETLRQLKACSRGGFIMTNGCPISFDTPAENIHYMIDTARRFGVSSLE